MRVWKLTYDLKTNQQLQAWYSPILSHLHHSHLDLSIASLGIKIAWACWSFKSKHVWILRKSWGIYWIRGLCDTTGKVRQAGVRHLLSQVGSNPERICKQTWQKSITAQRKSVPRLPPVPRSLGRRGNNASLSKNNPIFEPKVLLWLLIVVHHF